jgi:hypothetical protein
MTTETKREDRLTFVANVFFYFMSEQDEEERKKLLPASISKNSRSPERLRPPRDPP